MSAAQRIEVSDWIRSPVDREKARAAVEAAKRALLAADREASRREIVFALLCEAVETERAFKKPGPGGYVSGMPEVYHTKGEIFATEVAMAADNITYPPSIKPIVGAAQATRYMEVMKWLRYVEGRNRVQSKRLLWLLAHGLSPRHVAAKLRMRDENQVRGAKFRRLGDIVKRLEQAKIFD